MAALTVRKLNFGTYTGGIAIPTWSGLLMTTLDTPTVTGDTFVNDGRTFLEIASSATGSTITITKQVKNADGIKENVVIVVANGTRKCIGPFDTSFNNTSGAVALTYDSITGLTLAAVSLADDAA